MRKEVIIAIFAGFALGLIITVGINNAQKSLNRQKQELQAEEQPTEAANTSASPHTISITSPQNFSVMDESEITISGITTPEAFVAAISSEDESLGTADINGNFAIPFELSAGANIITVKSFTDSGEQTEALLEIVYSTADLNPEDDVQNETEEETDETTNEETDNE